MHLWGMNLTHRLQRPLRLFVVWIAVLAAACVCSELFAGLFLHLPSPYDWPFTPFHELDYDLIMFEPMFVHFHQLNFFDVPPDRAFAYPAPMAMLYRVVYLLPFQARTNLFLAFLVLLFVGSACGVYRTLVKLGLRRKSAAIFCACAVLLSYPMAFEAKQGNLELFVCLLVSGGIWLFLHQRGYGAATCFALAGSMKIFPFIFLGLFVARRQWRPVVYAVAVAAAVTLASLWILAPDISFTWRHLQAGMAIFEDKITLHVIQREIGFDHSLFSLVKRLWLVWMPLDTLGGVLHVYLIVMAVTGTGLFFGRILRLPVTNQVLALTACAVVMPPVSYDYTLIHLYAPLVLLAMIAASKPQGDASLNAVFVLLAVGLAPLSELIAHGSRFGGQMRALDLVALLVVALTRPFPSRFDSEPARSGNKRRMASAEDLQTANVWSSSGA
jgi:hypothetical protein